jgi:hypothetical protein
VELFSMALQEFAKEVGAGEDKHILDSIREPLHGP